MTIETANTQVIGAGKLLNIKRIWAEHAAMDLPRGKEVIAKFPDAEIIDVQSHWKIKELHGNEGNIDRWVRIKTEDLVLGTKKATTCRPNTRSSDFIAPSTSNGCAMACAYCYVPRRKGFANPITVFANIEQICRSIARHAGKQGVKAEPNQCDPTLWVYDIGESSDCSVDAAVSDNVKDLIDTFAKLPNAKASFATKFVNRYLLNYDPKGHTRIRFSLMPKDISRIVDIRTSSIDDRIGAINDFVEAGYEVHVNLSPIIIYDGWEDDWRNLLVQLDDELSQRAKSQCKTEIIFLTHNENLHEVNMGWHPGAEDYLWRPEIQQKKFSQTGMWNVRYKNGLKGDSVQLIKNLIADVAPWLEIRYAF